MFFLCKQGDDSTHPDPACDGGCWKAGDIVVARDGGLTEREFDVFQIVSLPGVGAKKFTDAGYLQPKLSGTDFVYRSLWRYDRATKRLIHKDTGVSKSIETLINELRD